MIKKVIFNIIFWYLHKNQFVIKENGYVIGAFQESRYNDMIRYYGYFDGINCRHRIFPSELKFEAKLSSDKKRKDDEND